MAYQKSRISKNSKSCLNEIQVLKDQIKTEDIKPVYLFSGDERFLLDYYVRELKKLVLKEDSDGLNLTVFEGKTASNAIIDACETYPVFSDRKLIIVKNSGLFAAGKKAPALAQSDDASESRNQNDDALPRTGHEQELFKNYIQDIQRDTCLIFIEDNVDKRTGLYKAIQRQGLHVHFDRLKPDELVKWVIRGFRLSNKSISEDAAQYLVSISDPDMYAIRNEIGKLELYTGSRNVVVIDDIKSVATKTIKSVVFDLMDAVADKNRSAALAYLDDMLQLKEPEQKILSMIAKQTGEILKMRKLLSQRISGQEVNQFFPGKHPFVMKKLTEQAGKLDEEYLIKLLKSCLEADSLYKKGRVSPRLALEILLSNI